MSLGALFSTPQMAQWSINMAISVVAYLRRHAMTMDEINRRLDLADKGQEPITMADVNTMMHRWRSELDRGRAVHTEED